MWVNVAHIIWRKCDENKFKFEAYARRLRALGALKQPTIVLARCAGRRKARIKEKGKVNVVFFSRFAVLFADEHLPLCLCLSICPTVCVSVPLCIYVSLPRSLSRAMGERARDCACRICERYTRSRRQINRKPIAFFLLSSVFVSPLFSFCPVSIRLARRRAQVQRSITAHTNAFHFICSVFLLLSILGLDFSFVSFFCPFATRLDSIRLAISL